MFTITLTRQQLYELYYEGPEPTIHLIESLPEELADQERILGGRQRRIIDSQRERNRRLAAHLKRVKAGCPTAALSHRISDQLTGGERFAPLPQD